MRRVILTMAVLAVVVGACGSSDSGSTTDTGLPDSPDRCEPAPQAVLDYLQTGLISDELVIQWGFAVKSTDYTDVWIVTTGIQGPDDEDFATFAIRAGAWPTEYMGAVAVGELSQTISTWGDDIDVIVTSATDGVTSAEACALTRLETGA